MVLRENKKQCLGKICRDKQKVLSWYFQKRLIGHLGSELGWAGTMVRTLVDLIPRVCWFSTLHREVFLRWHSSFPLSKKAMFDLI